MTREHRPSPACQALRPLRHVVVGTTLDQSSDPVLRAAWDLASAAGAELYVVHATDATPLAGDVHGEWLSPRVLDAELSKNKTLLGDQLQRVGIDPRRLGGWNVEVDSPHQVLLRAARRVSADLVVVGATRSGRLGRILGSTADRVTRQATCPVLVVRGEMPMPPRRVLVPVDLSDLSADALVCGLALLERVAGDAAEGMEVQALHVLDPEKLTRPEGMSDAELEAFRRSTMMDFLQEHSAAVAPAVEPVMVQGEARREILRRLEEQPVDLVLLSTHGRGGFERLMLGSVAAEVVRESPVSVLLVPPPAALGSALAKAVAAQASLFREGVPS